MKNQRPRLIADINALRTAAGHAELTFAQTNGTSPNLLRIWLAQASQGKF